MKHNFGSLFGLKILISIVSLTHICALQGTVSDTNKNILISKSKIVDKSTQQKPKIITNLKINNIKTTSKSTIKKKQDTNPNFTTLLQTNNLTMEYIVGFSTGHVGTTTFSSELTYTHRTTECGAILFSKNKYDIKHTKRKVDVYHYDTKNWTINKEINHIQRVYGLTHLKYFLALQTRVKPRCPNRRMKLIDMSHSSLYTHNGWISLSKEYPKLISVYFVRIRRDRLETVVSLLSRQNFFRVDYYYYHPFENTNNVILKIPKIEIWEKFDFIQKLLWVIDETEARWQLVLKENPHLRYKEILWSQNISTSFENSIDIIANITGMTRNVHGQKLRTHASSADVHNATLHAEIIRLDSEYQKIMGYKNI